jgi:hypothetical protein
MWWYGLIELVQDRDGWRALVNVVMTHKIPKKGGNSLMSQEPVSFSRRILLHEVSKQVYVDSSQQ